jgi:hypothetical protein
VRQLGATTWKHLIREKWRPTSTKPVRCQGGHYASLLSGANQDLSAASNASGRRIRSACCWRAEAKT